MVENKHNIETSWNGYPIAMYQGGLLHEPYFIAINNWGQVIIGPNKKMVAMYIVEELEVLIWIHKDMNAENGVLLWSVLQECNIKKG